MNTHTPDSHDYDHDRDRDRDRDRAARRAAWAARLGLDAAPAAPAAAPLPTPQSQPPPQPASVLEALAAVPARQRVAAAMVRVDGDGRVALRELADVLPWTSESADVTVLADRAARRLWVVPTPEPCGCATCGCGTPRPPSPAFAPSQLGGSLQSKRRLKLVRGLWSALGVEPGGDLVLAVAVDGALLLASVGHLAAALVADVGNAGDPVIAGGTTTDATPTGTAPSEAAAAETAAAETTRTNRRHLEVVA